MNSNWCVRILLHENETHAFFVVGLRKVQRGPLSLHLHLQPLSELSFSNIPSDRNIFLLETTLHYQSVCIKTPSYRNDNPFREGSILRFDIASSSHHTNLDASGSLAYKPDGLERFHLIVSVMRSRLMDAGAQMLQLALLKHDIWPATFGKLLWRKRLCKQQLPILERNHVETL